jgi:hypothetical protein
VHQYHQFSWEYSALANKSKRKRWSKKKGKTKSKANEELTTKGNQDDGAHEPNDGNSLHREALARHVQRGLQKEHR